MVFSAYTIQPMTRSELDLVVEWAAAEGWNPGLYDADCFYAADPQGFLMGWLGDEPVASISVVKYGSTFGFLGFYIVRPGFRGQGYGLQLWRAGLESLQGRTVGLDGVVAQQENYLKSGFALAYRNIRYEGIGDGTPAKTASGCAPLASVPIDAVIEYDHPFFPEDRADFLKCWLAQPESYGVAFTQNQTLVGYGLIRRCRQGHKIGPLFADSPAIAEAIFLTLKAQVGVGVPFYLDVPEVNRQAVALAERHTMGSMFETARMYIGKPPVLPLDRLFGVTTFELG